MALYHLSMSVNSLNMLEQNISNLASSPELLEYFKATTSQIHDQCDYLKKEIHLYSSDRLVELNKKFEELKSKKEVLQHKKEAILNRQNIARQHLSLLQINENKLQNQINSCKNKIKETNLATVREEQLHSETTALLQQIQKQNPISQKVSYSIHKLMSLREKTQKRKKELEQVRNKVERLKQKQKERNSVGTTISLTYRLPR